MSNYKIDEKLMLELFKYHLEGLKTPSREEYIVNALQSKYKAIERHIEYSRTLKKQSFTD